MTTKYCLELINIVYYDHIPEFCDFSFFQELIIDLFHCFLNIYPSIIFL